MKNLLIILIFLFTTIFSFKSFGEVKKGKWEFVKDDEYCLIQSAPVKTLIPGGKSRGENYILVYRMNKNPDSIIQITAGFNYKSSDSIKVKIDGSNYDFYADEDTAWANEDKKVIYAMKKGIELTLTGISSKGTTVVDSYTLKGFTAAFNLLSEDC